MHKSMLKKYIHLITIIFAGIFVFLSTAFIQSNKIVNFGSNEEVSSYMDAPKPGASSNEDDASENVEKTIISEFIFIDASGTGDYETLEEAIKNASPGAVIILDIGTYELTEETAINKSLSLIGTDPVKTIIHRENEDVVLRFEDNIKFFAEGITFTRKGTEPGSIIVIEKGDVSFNNCIFSNGRPHPDESNWGSGLFYYGTSKGTVTNCIAESNAFCGITVEEDSLVYLSNNILRKNAFSGLSYFGNFGGYAIKNECYQNGSDGIQVQSNSTPFLISNNCHDNKYAGIAYFDESAGIAFKNTCSKNQWGIYLTENAYPVISANSLQNNSKKDILEE